MKKFVVILMALIMVLAMCSAAQAEGPYTLTISGATGHTYDIYQIYTGDIAKEGDNTVLSNVKYGKNHYPVDGNIGDPVPADEINDLVNAKDPVHTLDSAVNNRENPFRDNLTPAEGQSTIEVGGIPAGYYMIVDVSTSLPEGQTKSPIILQVLESVTIASKHASITSQKKVDDKNDSDNSEDGTNWQDSADYDIGDAVPFQLSATIPSTYNTYSNYTLTFHDKQAVGFENPANFNVYIAKADGTQIGVSESGYEVKECSSEKCEYGGCSFTVEVRDINTIYGDKAFAEGDKIVVEYTAELNSKAQLGSVGNVNSMYVCHPDGHTPEDDVIVFTYELKINKIDGDSEAPLKGAGFTLYKWDDDANKWIEVGDEVKGENITTFTWGGIDAGKYKLKETTTPNGYNTIADMEFVVTAQHKAEWVKGGNSAFMDLIAKDNAGNVVFADAANDTAVEDGKLEGDVKNFKGVVLPETGAKGTVYLIGCSAMLVLVAAVFMVTRKKMSVYED